MYGTQAIGQNCNMYLTTLAVIRSKASFEQMEVLHQDHQSFVAKELSKYLDHRYTLKDARFLLVMIQHILIKFLLMWFPGTWCCLSHLG